MSEMDRDKFTSRRRKLAQQIYNGLKTHLPQGALAIHEPDDICAVGVDFGVIDGKNEYILVQIEDGTMKIGG